MAPIPRGRFVWHELATVDPEAATAFYGKVVGWKTQAYDQDPTYRLWMMNDAQKGGLMRLPETAKQMGAPPSWMNYISVPDVDATVRQAQGLGARVHAGPMDIPPGRFAALADPWGAGFSVFKPAPRPDLPMPGEPSAGDFVWHEHASPDWKKAWDFYAKLFGWVESQSMEMSPGNLYFIFTAPGEKEGLGGFYSLQPGMPGPAHWLTYIRVADADAAAKAIPRAGGRVMHGPMDVPGGARVAMCMDPQGAAFAVHSLTVSTSEPERTARGNGRPRARRAAPALRKTVRKAKARPKKPKPKRRMRPRARRPAR